MESPQHSPAGPDVPKTFFPVDIPVPPNAAAAFGYPGSARHVAFYWEPAGDELSYDDGRIAGTGAWHPFLQYRAHRNVSLQLRFWNLGYSDEEAEHWLVLDTETGQAWIAGIADARAFLQSQHPPQPPLRMVDLGRVREEMGIAISQRIVTVEQMQEFRRRQQQQLHEVLTFCNTWSRASS